MIPMPAPGRGSASSSISVGAATPPSLAASTLAVSLEAQRALNATCAGCLSADTMCSHDGSVFCGTCNKAALVPRVESNSA